VVSPKHFTIQFWI